MSVPITPEMQTFINWLKSDAVITDVTVDSVDSAYLSMLPSSVTAPLLFTITMSDPPNNKFGTARVILPDSYYSQPPGTYINGVDYGGPVPPPVDQLWLLTTYNNPDSYGYHLDHMIAYADPATGTIFPLFGFENVATNIEKVNPMLQDLVTLINTVTNTTVLYRYINPQILTNLDTDEAYNVYCYFGTATFVTYQGGKDAIGVAVIKQNFLNTSTHQTIVDYIADRIQEYKATK
jgi:hypothetical protein